VVLILNELSSASRRANKRPSLLAE
jgi:hypothetical protein